MEDNNPIQYTWNPLAVGLQYALVPDSVNLPDQVIRHLNMISYYEYRLRQPFPAIPAVAVTHTSTFPLENVYILPPVTIPSTASSSPLTSDDLVPSDSPKDDLVENRNPAHQVSIPTSNVSPVSVKIGTQEEPLDLSVTNTGTKRCLSPHITHDVNKRKRRNAKDKTLTYE